MKLPTFNVAWKINKKKKIIKIGYINLITRTIKF